MLGGLRKRHTPAGAPAAKPPAVRSHCAKASAKAATLARTLQFAPEWWLWRHRSRCRSPVTAKAFMHGTKAYVEVADRRAVVAPSRPRPLERTDARDLQSTPRLLGVSREDAAQGSTGSSKHNPAASALLSCDTPKWREWNPQPASQAPNGVGCSPLAVLKGSPGTRLCRSTANAAAASQLSSEVMRWPRLYRVAVASLGSAPGTARPSLVRSGRASANHSGVLQPAAAKAYPKSAACRPHNSPHCS